MAEPHEEPKKESLMENISEKIHGHDPSSDSDNEKEKSSPASSSSDSDNEKEKKEKSSSSSSSSVSDNEKEKKEKSSSSSSSSVSDNEKEKKEKSSPSTSSLKSNVYRLFGREMPVHKILGGRKLADVFLWRDKKISARVLGIATAIWVIFELLEYHLLTLICHLLILALALMFLWSNACTFINKSPPRFPEVHIPEESVLQFTSVLRSEINRALFVLRDVASGKDLKKFLSVIAALWVLSIVGKWCNCLTLFYIVFVLLHTLPVLYEKYEDQVDSFSEKAFAEIKNQYVVFDEKVLSKIPRGPLKDKKNL